MEILEFGDRYNQYVPLSSAEIFDMICYDVHAAVSYQSGCFINLVTYGLINIQKSGIFFYRFVRLGII